MDPVLGVLGEGRRPEPHLAIQFRGHRLRGGVAGPRRLLGQDHLDALHLADPPVADHSAIR